MDFNRNLRADLLIVTRLISVYATRKTQGLSASDDYHYFACGKSFESSQPINFSELDDTDNYGKYCLENNLSHEERALVCLSLLPDYDRLSFMLMANFKHESIIEKAPELGLVYNTVANYYQPSIQTWLWVIGKFNNDKRSQLIGEVLEYTSSNNGMLLFDTNPKHAFTTATINMNHKYAIGFLANKALEIEN